MNLLRRLVPLLLFAAAVAVYAGNDMTQQPASEPQPLSIQETDWSLDDRERWCDKDPELYANLMSYVDIDPFAATVYPQVLVN